MLKEPIFISGRWGGRGEKLLRSMLSFSSSTEWWLPFPTGPWISIASVVFLKLAGRFTAWS